MAVTTTVRVAYIVDEDGLPAVELTDLPEMDRVEFPELVGVDLDVAVEWAEGIGWKTVSLVDLDDEETHSGEGGKLYMGGPSFPTERMTFDHRDGRVVRAVAG